MYVTGLKKKTESERVEMRKKRLDEAQLMAVAFKLRPRICFVGKRQV